MMFTPQGSYSRTASWINLRLLWLHLQLLMRQTCHRGYILSCALMYRLRKAPAFEVTLQIHKMTAVGRTMRVQLQFPCPVVRHWGCHRLRLRLYLIGHVFVPLRVSISPMIAHYSLSIFSWHLYCRSHYFAAFGIAGTSTSAPNG